MSAVARLATLEQQVIAMIVYQALLRHPDNIANVRLKRHEIEQIGGKVEIAAPTASGMVAVTLWLPLAYQPEQFFPDLPFYPG